MTGETPEPSLREELEANFDAGTPELDAPPAAAGEPSTAEPLPALEPPPMWGKQYKEVFGKLAGTPDYRSAAEAWINQYKESQGYITKKEQELADYRKQLDPIREVLSPYEQYWQRQGMDTRQGLSQLLSWGQALASNPQATLLELSKLYNVNLREALAEQPYVDPQVQTLQQELQQVRQMLQQQQQGGLQEQQNRVLEQLKAFETATDEQGNPKHPHYQRVFDKMVGLARGGLTKSIEEAYELAVSLDKELQAEIAQKRAAEEAAARAAEAKKAAEASRTVKSKQTGSGTQPERNLRDEIAATAAALGFD